MANWLRKLFKPHLPEDAHILAMTKEAQSLQQRGLAEEAEALHRAILARSPGHWLSLEALAAIAYRAGHFQESLRACDELLRLHPSAALGYYRRANAKNALGQIQEALGDYDEALKRDPEMSNAHCNRGVVLGRLGRWEESLVSYDRAVELNSQDQLAFYNRGAALKELRRFDAALSSYDHAIRINANYAEPYVNRGHILQQMHRHREAVASYDVAIRLNAGYAEVFQARGVALEELRDYAGATGSYTRALELEPGRDFLLGQRRHAMMHICDWQGIEADQLQLAERLRRGEAVSTPFTMLALVDSPELHRLAAEAWTRKRYPVDDVLGGMARRAGTARLRVGYFSPDFREHAVPHLAAGVFEAHDRARFETVAFALGPRAEGPMRQRLERAFDRFVEVGHLSDLQVARTARDIPLDIAVDLAGFTAQSRPGIFALRAAPVQIGFLGYPGTMGADYMDYLVGDSTVFAAISQQYYREKLITLPHTYLPYDASRCPATIEASRAEHSLPLGAFVFCCFNNAYKLTPEAFGSWMRILVRIPDSVIWLSSNNELATQNLRMEAELRNVDPNRLIFAPRLPDHADHMARHGLASLFLDTWPYNAHATAMDALFAGLPVLTKVGKSFAGRVAAGVLNALGLPDLITDSPQRFEERAVELAENREELARLTTMLDKARTRTGVFDAVRYAVNLEAAFERIYQRFRSGLPAENCDVTR